MVGLAHIGAADIRVASKREAEGCAFVVCCNARKPSPWPDNVMTECAFCGRDIMHRPHAPEAPPKVCFGCALEAIEAGEVN